MEAIFLNEMDAGGGGGKTGEERELLACIPPPSSPFVLSQEENERVLLVRVSVVISLKMSVKSRVGLIIAEAAALRST